MTRENRKHMSAGAAREALAAYNLPPARLTFLGDAENITFRVDVSHPCGRYLLRLHKPQRHTAEIVRSEVAWLSALRTETDVVAPVAVPNWDGQTVTTLPGPETPQIWTLTTWIAGRFLGDSRVPSRAARVGETLARLHRHGETWKRPQGFARPRHDTQRLQEHLGAYRRAAASGLLTPDDLAVVEAAVERVYAAMGVVGQAPSDFGLIHGDFHNRNYLHYRGEVRPIDFSLCGDGYYLADLGYALCGLWHRSVGLAGYQSVRPLPETHKPLIETFMVSGILGETAFHLKNAQEQGRPFEHPMWLVGSLRDKFLRGERFLTDW